MSLNNTTLNNPTLVTVPCFSGAPWQLEKITPLAGRPMRTMRLPENLSTVEEYADFVAREVVDLDSFVLAGDSFGAVISLALATRIPKGLRGLILSGGFASNPLPAWKGYAARASRFAVGSLYRQGTLRFHAYQLSSEFDATAEIPHTQKDYRDLFIESTPRQSYISRVTSVIHFDVRNLLPKVSVPTLLITPEDDTLVGSEAASDMLIGIPNVREVVLPHTGHMFRFTHPSLYGETIADFLDNDIG
jgi:pimeloyl-ACP methyl ester carboxylesterase